jgi:hypothetical protein
MLTLSEMKDFTFETISLTGKGGKLSRRTILLRHLVGLRYVDVNKDGIPSRSEEAAVMTLISDLNFSKGDFNRLYSFTK